MRPAAEEYPRPDKGVKIADPYRHQQPEHPGMKNLAMLTEGQQEKGEGNQNGPNQINILPHLPVEGYQDYQRD